MGKIKNLSKNAIEMIDEAVLEIKHYTDPRYEDRKSWKGLALNAISVLVNIPYMTDMNMSNSDKEIWRLICQPYVVLAESKKGFNWNEIKPFLDLSTKFLTRYGYKPSQNREEKDKKTVVKKAPKAVRVRKPISLKTNNAVANIYLYTLFLKDPKRVEKLCPGAYSKQMMQKLAKDALWHLSSLGNNGYFDALLEMEDWIEVDEFNWTEMVLLLQQCHIHYVDPILWIEDHRPYKPVAQKANELHPYKYEIVGLNKKAA